ncbi:Bug family tripartite tricarboxylate transporter substrate binding protein [Bordetella genomosp. 13]|uniref:ABC transporter substrate-binding protein n=1 Tax=Bordetella genomosp. 13 TaxID=463040 RepID=A0A1W6ZK96_9BORD|nr:tripartite tricarboxylate transporter substrate binding protein [Bordetella genomosp. 13]ARP97570.1 hypothetical protein CAL15_20500 [Bordetella genomosp. 13]
MPTPARRSALAFARAATAIALSALAFASSAQTLSEPVKIEVGFSAGGSTDALARVIAPQLEAALKVPVIVENRPGANGNIAAAYVANGPANGSLLYMGSFNNPVNQAAGKKLSFEFTQDFTPVAMVAYVSNVLIVNASAPIHSVADLVALARKEPGRLTFGSAGPGSSLHMAGELFKRSAGVDLVHVPYKGSAPAIADLMGGHIDVMFDNLPSALELVKAGKVRALAVTSARRQPQLPDVPTVAEAGIADYDVLSFFALFAKTGTPEPLLAQMNSAVNAALGRAEVRDRILQLGAQPAAESREQVRAYTEREVGKWRDVIRANNIQLD